MDDQSWQDTMEAVAAAAEQFAEERVAEFADAETRTDGFHFPLNGKDRSLSVAAPEAAKLAASFLGALQCARHESAAGNAKAAAYAGFQAGLLATAVWKDGKGRSIIDVLNSIAAGGRPDELSDDEVGHAKVVFARLKGDGRSNNFAAKKAREAVNANRSEPISLSTIERAVGIRKRLSKQN